jgi:hypothetical protein
MGKETKITCDSCGTDVWGQRYFVLNIRKVMHGKQTLMGRFIMLMMQLDCLK